LSAVGTHVLIQIEPHVDEVELTRQVAQIPGVIHVTQVDGPYDVVAQIDDCAQDPDQSIATSAIRELDGVLHAIPLTVAREHAH
jgi:hypothetical protein